MLLWTLLFITAPEAVRQPGDWNEPRSADQRFYRDAADSIFNTSKPTPPLFRDNQAFLVLQEKLRQAIKQGQFSELQLERTVLGCYGQVQPLQPSGRLLATQQLLAGGGKAGRYQPMWLAAEDRVSQQIFRHIRPPAPFRKNVPNWLGFFILSKDKPTSGTIHLSSDYLGDRQYNRTALSVYVHELLHGLGSMADKPIAKVDEFFPTIGELMVEQEISYEVNRGIRDPALVTLAGGWAAGAPAAVLAVELQAHSLQVMATSPCFFRPEELPQKHPVGQDLAKQSFERRYGDYLRAVWRAAERRHYLRPRNAGTTLDIYAVLNDTWPELVKLIQAAER